MLHAVRHQFDRARDFDAILRAIECFARESGFVGVFYLHVPPAGRLGVEDAFHLGGCDLAPRYVAEKIFLTDPCAMQALHSTRPFVMRDIGRIRELSKAEQAFTGVAAQNGCADGLSLPAFGPAGRSGYLELTLPPGHDPVAEDRLRSAHWLAQQAHLRICDLLAERVERKALTAREREVLTWLAQGKSNEVIGAILGLSPHTIDTYLRRIYEKLEVCDRVSAALRGVAEGHITGVAPCPEPRSASWPEPGWDDATTSRLAKRGESV